MKKKKKEKGCWWRLKERQQLFSGPALSLPGQRWFHQQFRFTVCNPILLRRTRCWGDLWPACLRSALSSVPESGRSARALPFQTGGLRSRAFMYRHDLANAEVRLLSNVTALWPQLWLIFLTEKLSPLPTLELNSWHHFIRPQLANF